MLETKTQRVLVGVTGASGSIYAERLVAELAPRVARVYLVASSAGEAVARFELAKRPAGFSLREALEGRVAEPYRQVVRVFKNDNLFAPVASGSAAPSHMVILPCSMGTVARVYQGASSNLLERSADVMLKQKKPLLLCPRETPLSAVHLRNLLGLAELGVSIIPAMPAFYQKPQTIDDMVDFMVGRVLEMLGLDHELYAPWNAAMM